MVRQQSQPKWMNVFLWIAQVLLALSLIWAAWMKLLSPKNELALMWPWTADHPGLVRLTGWLDLLAGFGLILPGLFGVFRKLTVYAALGVVVLMLAAGIFHIARGETSSIGINVFFVLMAAFIAWGRK